MCRHIFYAETRLTSLYYNKKMYLCNNEGLHLAHLTAFSTMNKHVRAQSVETQYIASKRHTRIFMTFLVGDVMYHVPTMLNSLFVMI